MCILRVPRQNVVCVTRELLLINSGRITAGHEDRALRKAARIRGAMLFLAAGLEFEGPPLINMLHFL